MKIPFMQVPPKDGGVLNSLAADPLGRTADKLPAEKPPVQGTDGDPETFEEDSSSDSEPTMK